MNENELEALGKQWLRVVGLAKGEQILAEMEHVRFRDNDLSIKAGALLGFAGLMLAANLVFLSSDSSSFIALERTCGYIGLAALFLLMAGAFCALISIMISRKGTYSTAWSSFGLMKLYHDRRKRWLTAGSFLTILGTLVYVGSMTSSAVFRQCTLPW